MVHHRIRFLKREIFDSKLSLNVGLVEAAPQLDSPYITPLDYWGYVKDIVPDINARKTRIQDAILTTTGLVLANTWSNI